MPSSNSSASLNRFSKNVFAFTSFLPNAVAFHAKYAPCKMIMLVRYAQNDWLHNPCLLRLPTAATVTDITVTKSTLTISTMQCTMPQNESGKWSVMRFQKDNYRTNQTIFEKLNTASTSLKPTLSTTFHLHRVVQLKTSFFRESVLLLLPKLSSWNIYARIMQPLPGPPPLVEYSQHNYLKTCTFVSFIHP